MKELYAYVIMGLFVAWFVLSVVYALVSVTTHVYMTIYHKNFWKRVAARPSFSLTAPRFGAAVDNFYALKRYKHLEVSKFKSFAAWYGPAHALISEKLMPLFFIAANVCIIILALLSALGVL